jgi:hypothetical protein
MVKDGGLSWLAHYFVPATWIQAKNLQFGTYFSFLLSNYFSLGVKNLIIWGQLDKVPSVLGGKLGGKGLWVTPQDFSIKSLDW